MSVGSAKMAIDAATCTGCGLCILSCPTDVIRFDEALHKAVVVYANDCQVCYLCEDDCPTHSIALSHDISNSRRFSAYDQFGLEI
jgi:NAD-dependent dihydropyrimidine dehydrogenase PreA subunit